MRGNYLTVKLMLTTEALNMEDMLVNELLNVGKTPYIPR